MSNVIYSETNRIVDHETGEIKQTVDIKSVRLAQEPEFIKLYLQGEPTEFGKNRTLRFSDQS